jgi:hypothetical protein
MIRQMTLKQGNASIDFIDQTSFGRQLMNGSDTSISDCLMASVDIVADIASRHHRLGLIVPVSFLGAFFYFSLAFSQFFTDIFVHSKWPFLFSTFLFSQTNNILNLRAFRVFFENFT